MIMGGGGEEMHYNEDDSGGEEGGSRALRLACAINAACACPWEAEALAARYYPDPWDVKREAKDARVEFGRIGKEGCVYWVQAGVCAAAASRAIAAQVVEGRTPRGLETSVLSRHRPSAHAPVHLSRLYNVATL